MNKEYKFLIGYQDNIQCRKAFNDLAIKVFKLSFEDWYQAGYWNEKYIPYTLFDEDKAVANLSINIMDFCSIRKKQRYIQIGTVMTDPDYRNKGLSRFLMEKVMEELNGKCDFIYLYANNSAVDFYPKFGFDTVKEFECFKSIRKKSGCQSEQLNMDIQSNRDRLYEYAKNSTVFGKLSMQENADLVMFYCISFLKKNVYFIPSLNVIAVAKFGENKFQLLDVFGEANVELDEIIFSLIDGKPYEVSLGFTPKEAYSYKIREITGGDTLFIQKGKTLLFDNKLMFPVLSHA
jgi:ribosomal protein S18 acetylase RimI-like enzyme